MPFPYRWVDKNRRVLENDLRCRSAISIKSESVDPGKLNKSEVHELTLALITVELRDGC